LGNYQISNSDTFQFFSRSGCKAKFQTEKVDVDEIGLFGRRNHNWGWVIYSSVHFIIVSFYLFILSLLILFSSFSCLLRLIHLFTHSFYHCFFSFSSSLCLSVIIEVDSVFGHVFFVDCFYHLLVCLIAIDVLSQLRLIYFQSSYCWFCFHSVCFIFNHIILLSSWG
jgi:hypothetical protein